MAITEQERKQAENALMVERAHGHAVAARYDQRARRIIVSLHTGLELMIPPDLVEGLQDAEPEDLVEIEISPSGLGLHWPALDADVYVPGLLAGQFGSSNWMARELGAKGGSSRSEAKKKAARLNGLKGGRPRKGHA